MPSNNEAQRNEMTIATRLETLQQLTGADVLDFLEYAEGFNIVTDPSKYELGFILGHGTDAGEVFGMVQGFWTSFDATEEEASEIAEGLNQFREECAAPEDLKIFATIREN